MTIRVDVWSDIACPWCWVGKRHLERALKPQGAEVVWHAFELDPTAPQRPPEVPYIQRLARKYGTDEAGARAMVDRMTDAGAQAGLEMRFDRIRVTNTFDAHRLLAWASRAGKGAQNALKERLFSAYLTEGEDLGSSEVLTRLASDVGLESQTAADILERQAFADDVRQDEAMAHQLGIQGVPFFVFAQRYGVSGAQPPVVLSEILKRAQEEMNRSTGAARGESSASAASPGPALESGSRPEREPTPGAGFPPTCGPGGCES
ncbi:MAG: DsbA family oxidoreductase [Myxococcota bacterium]